MVDFNGVVINVGDTVHLTGVVSAVDSAAPRFNEVTVTLTHPVPGVPDVLVAPGADAITNSGGRKIVVCAALSLTH